MKAVKFFLTVIITAAIVGGGVYYWQQNKSAKTETPAQTTGTSTPPSVEIPTLTTEKTFDREAFSFVYPKKYIEDGNSLWEQDFYFQFHLNPQYACDTCDIPKLSVKNFEKNDAYNSDDRTLENYVIGDLGLHSSGVTLDEIAKNNYLIKYEQAKIGENNFIKITNFENIVTTYYYTENANEVVRFTVVNLLRNKYEEEEEESESIISTLKFKDTTTKTLE